MAVEYETYDVKGMACLRCGCGLFEFMLEENDKAMILTCAQCGTSTRFTSGKKLKGKEIHVVIKQMKEVFSK
jgi:uncharacterized Zn finger protein